MQHFHRLQICADFDSVGRKKGVKNKGKTEIIRDGTIDIKDTILSNENISKKKG